MHDKDSARGSWRGNLDSRAGDAPRDHERESWIPVDDALKVSAALLPTLLIEPEGRFLLANSAILQLLDRPSDSIANLRLDQLIAPQQQETMPNCLKRFREMESFPRECDVEMVCGDGSPLKTKWSVAVVGPPKRRLFLLTIQSASNAPPTEAAPPRHTEIPRLEELSLLTADVVYDFKNMLSIIMVRSQLVQSHLGPERPEHEALAEIDRTAQQAGLLADRLLELCRKSVQDPAQLRRKTGGCDR